MKNFNRTFNAVTFIALAFQAVVMSAAWFIVAFVASVVTKAFAHFDSLKARPPPLRQFKCRRPAKRIVKVCGQL